MSAEMNLRSERTDKILDELEDRIRRVEKELVQLRGGQRPDRKWQPFNQITDLILGDAVRWKNGDELFHVVRVEWNHATVAHVAEVTNPSTWEVLR